MNTAFYNTTADSRIPSLLGTQLVNAIVFFADLERDGLSFHPDDIPYETIIDGDTKDLTFSSFEAGQVTAIMAILKLLLGNTLLFEAVSLGRALANQFDARHDEPMLMDWLFRQCQVSQDDHDAMSDEEQCRLWTRLIAPEEDEE